MVGGLLEGDRTVTQVHFGGGTPTYLAREQMATLMSALRATFAFEPDAEISIEVDPRTVDADDIG